MEFSTFNLVVECVIAPTDPNLSNATEPDTYSCTCLVDLQATVTDEALASSLQAEQFTFIVPLDEEHLFDLADVFTLVQATDPSCGQIGFMLSEESANIESLVSVTHSSIVTLQSVQDLTWLGEHTVTFDYFLIDIDPVADFRRPVPDFAIQLKIEEAAPPDISIVDSILR